MSSLSRFLPLLPALGLVACSGSGGDSASAPAVAGTGNASADPAAQGFRMKTGVDGDDDQAKLLEKYGSQSPFMSDSKGKPLGEYKAASQFDKANSQFNRGYAGKEYQAGEFKKKSWWGSQDYAKKVYGGDTDANDLRKASRHGSQTAGENVKVSRDAGKTYQTGDYAAGAARESGKDRITKFAGAEDTDRSNVFSDPDIIPWQQQHGVTIEETKSKMGR